MIIQSAVGENEPAKWIPRQVDGITQSFEEYAKSASCSCTLDADLNPCSADLHRRCMDVGSGGIVYPSPPPFILVLTCRKLSKIFKVV